MELKNVLKLMQLLDSKCVHESVCLARCSFSVTKDWHDLNLLKHKHVFLHIHVDVRVYVSDRGNVSVEVSLL